MRGESIGRPARHAVDDSRGYSEENSCNRECREAMGSTNCPLSIEWSTSDWPGLNIRITLCLIHSE